MLLQNVISKLRYLEEGKGKVKKNGAYSRTTICDDFLKMADSIGGIYSASDSKIDQLLTGRFHFHRYNDGISTHVSNTKELQNSSNFVELPAAISFNILFEGSINISLANEAYQLGLSHGEAVECSAIIAPHPELLTRYIKKDMYVRKLNLFVERSWLEKKCKNINNYSLINKLFHRKTTFLSWKASNKVVTLASQIIQESPSDTISDEIKSELLTMQLLLECIQDLECLLDEHSVIQTNIPQDSYTQQKLKQQIDDLSNNHRTLQEIATKLNTSVSTLQRKFKKCYGLTVSSYLTQRKLEKARKSLIFDGKSIGEAAYLAGYAYPSNFIAAFKKRFSITPTELVRKHIRNFD